MTLANYPQNRGPGYRTERRPGAWTAFMTMTHAIVLVVLGLVACSTVDQSNDGAQLVNLSGKLVCLGCDGRFHSKSERSCSIHWQLSALKVEVTTSGEKTNRYYTFLPSDAAKPLLEDVSLHGKMIQPSGTVHPGSQVVDVESFMEVGATGGLQKND